MRSRTILISHTFAGIIAALQLFGAVPQSKSAKKISIEEQSLFSAEQDDVDEPVLHPVSLPAGALRVLGESEDVTSCLKREGVPRDKIPASWFVASRIRLDGPRETDFVVLPNLTLNAGPEGPNAAMCFLGANIASFWVVRKTSHGYQLALAVRSHDLEISKNRTKGLRDIKAIAIMQAGTYISTVIYRFDGKTYRQSKVDNTLPTPNE
ncbi:MAG: hypothetical protein WBE21_08850 [Candidatus Acidiferrales bacterium]